MTKYYQKDQSVKNFCYMLFEIDDKQDNPNNSFNTKRAIFNEILKVLGFKSFRDPAVFSERDTTINKSAVEALMNKVSENERLSTELEIKKAKGDPDTWIKYAFNKMGRLLGLTNHVVKLMVGKKKVRKWSIRGLNKIGGKACWLYNESLEIAYMRYNNKRRRCQAILERSIITYNKFKKALNDKHDQRLAVPCCRQENGRMYLHGDDELDESHVDEIHNKYLKKRLERKYDKDEELFKSRTHEWDGIAKDVYVPDVEDNFFWRSDYHFFLRDEIRIAL